MENNEGMFPIILIIGLIVNAILLATLFVFYVNFGSPFSKNNRASRFENTKEFAFVCRIIIYTYFTVIISTLSIILFNL